MQQHFIVCGLGRIGWRVLQQLRAAGAKVVAIDNRCAADDARLHGATLIAGDCRHADVLHRAGLQHARGVVILTSDDLVSLSVALLVRHLHPTIRVVVRLFNQSLVARLGSAMGNMQALSASALAAPLLALIARTGATSDLVHLDKDRRKQIATLDIGDNSPLAGRRLADIAQQVALVAHQAARQPFRFLHEIDMQAVVGAGDRLVVCGPPPRIEPLLAEGSGESLPELLWAGTVKRFSRVVVRTLAAVEWPVKVCTAVFLSVIIASVLIFRFGMTHDSFVDAFYRTISLLATGADMRGQDVEPGSWQKAFIGSLRLVGTALTAAFTAIFTNYLIRANLGGALEVRRIPESGHIIVCGLGNVGFRVVEELIRLGEPVVAIETNQANPFISTARRLGAAVIVANATVAQVLRQAHAPGARAVVAATSNDLVNVEIGLMVRELAPKQRVVLRLIDSQLAGTLRQSANVRLAVSIPDLAAPAFAAALYGDRVRGMFQIEGRMFTVYDLVVHPHETFLTEATLDEMARNFRFVPLTFMAADGVRKSLSADARLAIGDQLTMILALDDLQHLMRREEMAETVQSTTASE
jgi:Trk K+ transport system NAD-binding subunit